MTSQHSSAKRSCERLHVKTRPGGSLRSPSLKPHNFSDPPLCHWLKSIHSLCAPARAPPQPEFDFENYEDDNEDDEWSEY